jgi:hypothetical protein
MHDAKHAPMRADRAQTPHAICRACRHRRSVAAPRATCVERAVHSSSSTRRRRCKNHSIARLWCGRAIDAACRTLCESDTCDNCRAWHRRAQCATTRRARPDVSVASVCAATRPLARARRDVLRVFQRAAWNVCPTPSTWSCCSRCLARVADVACQCGASFALLESRSAAPLWRTCSTIATSNWRFKRSTRAFSEAHLALRRLVHAAAWLADHGVHRAAAAAAPSLMPMTMTTRCPVAATHSQSSHSRRFRERPTCSRWRVISASTPALSPISFALLWPSDPALQELYAALAESHAAALRRRNDNAAAAADSDCVALSGALGRRRAAGRRCRRSLLARHAACQCALRRPRGDDLADDGSCGASTCLAGRSAIAPCTATLSLIELLPRAQWKARPTRDQMAALADKDADVASAAQTPPTLCPPAALSAFLSARTPTLSARCVRPTVVAAAAVVARCLSYRCCASCRCCGCRARARCRRGHVAARAGAL